MVRGRRWRRADPSLPRDVAAALSSHLGRGRSAVRNARDDGARSAARRRVGLAKHGLGERGTPWWEQSPAQRTERWARAMESLDALPEDP